MRGTGFSAPIPILKYLLGRSGSCQSNVGLSASAGGHVRCGVTSPAHGADVADMRPIAQGSLQQVFDRIGRSAVHVPLPSIGPKPDSGVWMRCDPADCTLGLRDSDTWRGTACQPPCPV